MPKAGWSNYEHFYGLLAGGLLIVLLLTGLVSMILALDEHKNRFKKLAVTDVLTRINNRHGFEEQVRQYLKSIRKLLAWQRSLTLMISNLLMTCMDMNPETGHYRY